MSGPFKENWKRLSNRYPPNSTASAMEDKDILRVEDIDLIFAASGVVSVSGIIPASGDLLVGIPGGWSLLNIGSTSQTLQVVGGTVAWGVVSGGSNVAVRIATDPTTTVISSDYLVAVSGQGAPQTINLTVSPIDGERKLVKDALGVAATGSITVDGNGFLIDGTANVVLANNYQGVSFIFAAPLGQWLLV